MNRIKDDFKSKEYYQKELENLEKRINRYKDNLNQENASRLHIAIGLKLLSVILIKYQLGYEIDEIKHDVLEYIENDKQKVLYCEGNLTYDDVANLLSLAYLFDVDSEQVDFIKTKMVEEKYIDIRLDIIRNLYFAARWLPSPPEIVHFSSLHFTVFPDILTPQVKRGKLYAFMSEIHAFQSK